MSDLLHERGVESLIPARNRQTLIDYAEKITSELPEVCSSCPAAYLCAVALNEDSGFGFPRTPTDVRRMHIKKGESSWSMLSGQAQFALKSIVSDANKRGKGPNVAGDACCLDPDTKIDINETDLYGR